MNKVIIACTASVFAALLALALWQKSALNDLSERLERVEASAGLPVASSSSAKTQRTVEPRDQGLTRRLAKLERAMSVRQGLSRPAGPPGGHGSLSGVVASDAEDPESLPDTGDVAPAARAVVKDLVRNELKLRDEERFEKRKARRLEEMVKRIEALADKNDIDTKTRGQMVSIMSAEREQISSFWREAREGNITRKEAHTKMSEVRGETDNNMKSILDDDQFAAYEEDRQSDRHRGPPPPRNNPANDKPKTESQ